MVALGLATGIVFAGDLTAAATWGLLSALCVFGLGAFVWAILFEHQRAKRATTEIARLESLLAAAPQAWSRWEGAAPPRLAPEFPALLNRTHPIEQPEDIAAALSPADATAFIAAMKNLRCGGEEFRMDVLAVDGRHLRVAGRRGYTAADGPPCDVVWLDDVSAHYRALEAAKTAHTATRTALAELRTVLNALPVPVWVRRAGAEVTWCNNAYARAVDVEPERAVAEAQELMPGGAGRGLAEQALAESIAQSQQISVVIGAQRRLLEVTEAPLPAPDGGRLTVGYALDLTPSQELRAELDRHIAAHAEVLEHLSAGVVVFGPDQRLKFFNQAYMRLGDLDETFLRGEPTVSEVIEELHSRRKLPEYADYQKAKRDYLARYRRMETTEELLHLSDGTTHRILMAPYPLGGMVSIKEDVTSALALESSYNTLVAVQQETLENLAEGIAVFGGDGRLKLFNPAFTRIWNLSDEVLWGEPHITAVFERLRPFFENSDWGSLKDDMVDSTLDRSVRSGRLERSDGSVVEFSTVPLPDGAVLNSYLDVTDSARLEQTLRATNARLEATDQLKGEFITMILHHLRTPLTGMGDTVKRLVSGPLAPRQQTTLTEIVSVNEHLLTIINDVLLLIDGDIASLKRRPVNVAVLLDFVAAVTREWAFGKGIRVEVAAAPDLGVVYGDEGILKRALFNLVMVATHRSTPGGRVVLAGQRVNDSIVLDIGESTPATLEEASVAARFNRLDPRNQALRLEIAKTLLELFEGHMKFDDLPGQGLRIHCELPHHHESAAADSE